MDAVYGAQISRLKGFRVFSVFAKLLEFLEDSQLQATVGISKCF
jgi:hypothetical protein